jgi:hypothetical protein
MALEREKGAKQDSNHVPTSSNFADNKKLGFGTKLHSGRSLVAILFIIICRRYFRSTDF